MAEFTPFLINSSIYKSPCAAIIKYKWKCLFLIFVTELTRVNPDRNIFSINVELTSTFLLYRGLVHHHHRILNYLFNDPVTLKKLLLRQKETSFATNSDFLIPISLQPNVVDLFKLWILSNQITKVWK